METREKLRLAGKVLVEEAYIDFANGLDVVVGFGEE